MQVQTQELGAAWAGRSREVKRLGTVTRMARNSSWDLPACTTLAMAKLDEALERGDSRVASLHTGRTMDRAESCGLGNRREWCALLYVAPHRLEMERTMGQGQSA
jgi:hypothetical protein